MKLSIVTTLYFSAPYLQEFYNRVKRSVNKITDDYEIIFVNDGSPDESLETAKSLLRNDGRIKIIELSRNYGENKAIITGLNYASGDYVFTIDCDLEEQPEAVLKFYNELVSSQGIDIVYGVQAKRSGKGLKKVGGAFFYRIFNLLSKNKIPENVLTSRLMTRRFLDNLLQMKDKEPFFNGLCGFVGFNQKQVKITKQEMGKTTYGFIKRYNLFINAMLIFTSQPLFYIFYGGIFVSLCSLFYIFYLLFEKYIFGIKVEGWISIMISIWFLGGVLMSSLGVIGLYLSKIFDEVRDRPIAIIKKVHDKNNVYD